MCFSHVRFPLLLPREDAPAATFGAIASVRLEFRGGFAAGGMAMNDRSTRLARAAAVPLLLLAFATALAQEAGGPTTRLLVTETRIKPDKIADWLALQRGEVVPALKKAGVKQYTVFQTLIGDTNDFVVVRPLPSFTEFDGASPLERALGADKAAALIAKLRACEDSVHRSIENRHDDLYLDPGKAQALFVSRYRAMPGKARDYMSFVHTEMYPVMVKAKANGTFSGIEVTTSVQGGEPGIITLNMYYPDFAPLDGPPPIAKTLGPQGTAEFLTKGAGLITQLEQRILKRVPELSF
jgi:hypothetical protein